MRSSPPPKPNDDATGVVGVIGAYIWWGISPLFFKLLSNIEALEIIAHRVIWTLLLLAGIKSLGYARNVFREKIRDTSKSIPYFLSMACLLGNWLLFTWAVIHGHVLDTSLGYFINPLLSVLVGVLFLGERLRPLQLAAVLLATLGVLQMVVRLGQLPWIALLLAVSWCIYGVIRKQAKVDAINGLALELVFGLPIAIGYLTWKQWNGTLHFGMDRPWDAMLLVLAGPITMVPLLLFGYAAQRMSLISVGILQYISPSLSFILAVFAFHEPFDNVKLLAFVCIWTALAIYTVDTVRTHRQRMAAAALPAHAD